MLPVIGMGDIDEGVRPLSQAFSEKVGDSVFGHYVVSVRSRRYHTGTYEKKHKSINYSSRT